MGRQSHQTIQGQQLTLTVKHNTRFAAFDGLMVGLGFTAVLVLLGAMRELLGSGTLFANMHLLLGNIAQSWTVKIADYKQFLFFILPPSAFICLGFIIAGKNIIDERLKQRAAQQAKEVVVGSKRVRTTGHIS
mgnify:CR=1 FL=1